MRSALVLKATYFDPVVGRDVASTTRPCALSCSGCGCGKFALEMKMAPMWRQRCGPHVSG